MNPTHSVPRTIPGVISLASRCRAAAAALGDGIGLKHNDAAAITADFHDLVGLHDAGPEAAGKEMQLNQARFALISLAQSRRAAVAEARTFNERAIDLLKSHLGRRWNPNWLAAGFVRASLALPRDPFALLLQLREYLRANPGQEVESIGVTAARADALATAIGASTVAEAHAVAARTAARKARDAAFKKLYKRMVGLHAELKQLLAPDDMRWRTFGFARPSDRRMPQAVPEVTVRAGAAAGEVIVEWEAATGAESYRVMREIEGLDPEPVEVGIVTGRLAIISDVPEGRTIKVFVTARNVAGETMPTRGSLLPPSFNVSSPPTGHDLDKYACPNDSSTL